MVADRNGRRKGVAFEALKLFMAYAVKYLVGLLLILLLSHSIPLILCTSKILATMTSMPHLL